MNALTIDTTDVQDLIGAMVFDPSDDRIGEIRQVYIDADTELPTWVGVRVGILGAEVLVPLEGADWNTRTLRASISRSSARTAPLVDLDEPLSQPEQDQLFRHYGIPHACAAREDVDLSAVEGDDVCYSVDDRSPAGVPSVTGRMLDAPA